MGGLAIRYFAWQSSLQSRGTSASACLLFVLALIGCNDTGVDNTVPASPPIPAGVITLGDIDPDEPATRVRRIQPLADLLAERLREHGIGRGHVRVARNIQEMAQLMRDGEVDLFLDSPFPILAVNRLANSTNLLLRYAKEDAEYWSVFISRTDSGVRGLDDLKGNVAVFQEPHSTSGFLLPVASLMERGFDMRAVAQLDADVDDSHVGCYFSGDEENTIDMVLGGDALVGVISNQDFREIPEASREQIFILHETASVPRQLVTARPGLDPELTQTIRSALLGLSDAEREKMAAQDAPRGWTWKFAELSDEATATLSDLEAKMGLLPACVAVR